MSSPTKVSQQKSVEISNKEILNSSQRGRSKNPQQNTNNTMNSENKYNTDLNESSISNLSDDNKIESRLEKQKDKKEDSSEVRNQLVGSADNKIALLKETINLFSDLFYKSYRSVLEIPEKIMYFTKLTYEEGSKVLVVAEELTNVIVSRLWNINVRRVSISTLNSINMSLYRSNPPRTAYGTQGALKIWNAYGIWTSENVEQKLTDLCNDLYTIFTESGLINNSFIKNMIDKLIIDIEDIKSIQNQNDKIQKLEEVFGVNFVRSICLFKEVCNQIDREGFDHKAFADGFFNTSILHAQHSASAKLKEWVESILEVIKSGHNTSFLPLSGEEINKVIPHEYQCMVMSSYAASKLQYECTPPKILTKQLLQSSISRKLIAASLINKLILSLSNNNELSLVEIQNDILEDAVKCIVASLFKNMYNKDTKLQKEFENAFVVLKNSLIEKKVEYLSN